MISTRGRSGSGGGKQSPRLEPWRIWMGRKGDPGRGRASRTVYVCSVWRWPGCERCASCPRGEACVREGRRGRMPEPEGKRQGKADAQDANHTHTHKRHTRTGQTSLSLLRMACTAALLCSPNKKCEQRVIGALACCFSTGNKKQGSMRKYLFEGPHSARPKGGQTT